MKVKGLQNLDLENTQGTNVFNIINTDDEATQGPGTLPATSRLNDPAQEFPSFQTK